jgi:hygromycin-B 4-O-kinase
MLDLRPVVEPSQVLALLYQYFSASVTDLVLVEGGSIARTFAFRTGGQDYIIRFNFDRMMQSNFPKEIYLWQRLVSTQIPVPPILQVGRLGDLHFAISRKMPGKSLMHYKPEEIASVLPQIVETIDAIHHVNVSDTQGYGVFNDHGRGGATSWRAFLSKIADEEPEQDYYGKWHYLFDDTFLAREVFDEIYHHMLGLLENCPEERYLVHGNLSLANILAHDGKLTAILDWLDARYGDFVYDIAILDYWSPTLGVSERFRWYYHDRQIAVPAYEERILCYQCFVTLDAMRFYAKSGDKSSYQVASSRMLQRLRSGTNNV